MSFKDFKKNQTGVSEALADADAKAKSPSNSDDRVWTITKDKAGEGQATLRFLPQKDPSKTPIIQVFRHGAIVNSKWLIDECPKTIGNDCPICEYSSSIWNDQEQLARKFWRKKTYIANVLIVDDPGYPENNGQVKIFKFGKQIYDLITKVANNDDESERLDIFSFDNAHDFKMKMIQVDDYNNYDKKSTFSVNKSDVCDGDVKLQEEVYNAIYDLDEFTAEDLFKTYDELQEKLDRFTAAPGTANQRVAAAAQHQVEQVTQPEPKLTETTGEGADDFASLLSDDPDDDIPF